MPPGGNKSDNADPTEDPAFGDAGEANPPDPTPEADGGDAGGGDDGGDE